MSENNWRGGPAAAAIADILEGKPMGANADLTIAQTLMRVVKKLRGLDKVRVAAEALIESQFGKYFAFDPAAKNGKPWFDLAAALYGEDDERVKKLKTPKFHVGELLADCHENGEFAFVVKTIDGTHVIDYRNGKFSSQWRIINDERNYRLATADEIKAARGEL